MQSQFCWWATLIALKDEDILFPSQWRLTRRDILGMLELIQARYEARENERSEKKK